MNEFCTRFILIDVVDSKFNQFHSTSINHVANIIIFLKKNIIFALNEN